MKGKGNDGTGDTPERDLWQTKQEFWDLLNKQYGFNFDCCASKENSKCEEYSSNFEEQSFNYLIDKVCWMNPPFSKTFDMFKHFFTVVSNGVAIFRCDNMETKVWQDIILKEADWILIPKGRISYTPFDISIRGGSTRFPSALIGIGVDIPKNIEGYTLKVVS